MIEITSTKNQLIIDTSKLITKKERDKSNLFLIEGDKLINEAINAGYKLKQIFVDTQKYEKYEEIIKKTNLVEQYMVKDYILQKLTDTVTPQGIVAVFEKIEPKEIEAIQDGRFLYIEEVSNPSNVGAIIRSANAFNLDGVILDEKSADIYSPKIIRGSMGSVFKLNIYKGSIENLINLKQKGFTINATALNEKAISIDEVEFNENEVVIIGNEGSGVSKQALDIADQNLFININKEVDSLNAAVAASIIAYKMKK